MASVVNQTGLQRFKRRIAKRNKSVVLLQSNATWRRLGLELCCQEFLCGPGKSSDITVCRFRERRKEKMLTMEREVWSLALHAPHHLGPSAWTPVFTGDAHTDSRIE